MKHDTSTYQEGTHHTLFYAQSWMVMHYLLNQKKLPETGTYFELAQNQHVPVEEAISKAYGMSSAQFEQAVKDYFHSLRALFTALDASKQPGVAAKTRRRFTSSRSRLAPMTWSSRPSRCLTRMPAHWRRK